MRVPGPRGIDTSAYVSAETWQAERARLFSRSWQFAGFRGALAQPNDWLTVEVAGRSVVVQNFDGELRAFVNVCSHRQARLRNEACGNGLLRCPYHGWTYNGRGVPVGIPGNEAWFGLDRAARETLALRRVDVATCGALVFVRWDETGDSLETFLGGYHAILAVASETLSEPFAEGDVVWRCNWKIGIEGAIEGYHLPMIHGETFQNLVSEVLPASRDRVHSLGPSRLAPDTLASLERIGTRLGLARLAPSDLYDHYLIFPNICITVTAGLTLSVQVYEPTSPAETRLRFWLLTGTSAKPDRSGGVVRRSVLDNLATFNDIVLREDQRICEIVQSGRSDLPLPPAILGRNEERLVAFHDAWRETMAA